MSEVGEGDFSTRRHETSNMLKNPDSVDQYTKLTQEWKINRCRSDHMAQHLTTQTVPEFAQGCLVFWPHLRFMRQYQYYWPRASVATFVIGNIEKWYLTLFEQLPLQNLSQSSGSRSSVFKERYEQIKLQLSSCFGARCRILCLTPDGKNI